jgi:hypothetical protein
MQGRFTSIEKLKKAMERLDSMDCVREFKRANKGANRAFATGESVAALGFVHSVWIVLKIIFNHLFIYIQ